MKKILQVKQLSKISMLILCSLFVNYLTAGRKHNSNLPPNVRELNTADPLEQMLAEEAANLDRAIGFSTAVRITTGPIEANPQFGILINKRRLQEHLNEAQMNQIRDLIRAVLAHEKAHWIQFRDPRYGFQIFRWGMERKRIIECQADILAGKYWREAFGLESFKRLEANSFI